ncbi:hypothetical protein GQF56_24615 [Rhodobacter sphaeroides]|uniref:Uncharacterized protein n=1 Tax=Cereibacter sphaeroides (strain ATCC 17023 / DSM 158 / JCM 6121 / CCUG 31486 / LMG 2827 / NBRC 12203 / NCIMB 8253 / ATH 2.4.1.) TaxID=272943 RepID=Q3IX14_CERS4|nr:hypothetical protein [Cereibacter sphaeroides]ABA80920.1 hypothetical protein RSP_3312 [Cereibacter sphaeroides 2.4.1]AMJ49242.1 hypothetical protein APX01_16890 [Cereibacter sphaeroides]ANS35949.1 hypothetical protein A3858_16890 [Cereibacter sphaeroides]ATN65013.1 hypothetical protein A3857_16905 [Cereibacter sphaeroides]AXC63211.1 hypothetical protein DQL45_17620 [Cereibacter sphaeroides 2.4.1]
MTEIDTSTSAVERLAMNLSGAAGSLEDADLFNRGKQVREAAGVLRALAAERDRLRGTLDVAMSNYCGVWEAMRAMRDGINEHIPIPSEESDLLQGPEASVFCATVATAVISAITKARAETAARAVWAVTAFCETATTMGFRTVQVTGGSEDDALAVGLRRIEELNPDCKIYKPAALRIVTAEPEPPTVAEAARVLLDCDDATLMAARNAAGLTDKKALAFLRTLAGDYPAHGA